LSIDEETIRAANGERQHYGFLNNASLIVASVRLYGITVLASHDGGFARLADVQVYSPTDL
jgi:predicted nucleic acid-binding protein